MSLPTAIVLLPYAVDVLLKLSDAVLTRKIAENELQALALKLRPPVGYTPLTGDQRAVILDHLAHISLKTTAVVTTFTSAFAAVVIVAESQATPKTWWVFIAFLLIGMSLLWWILPKQVYYFAERGWGGIERANVAVGAFCLYDIILAAISLSANYAASHPKP